MKRIFRRNREREREEYRIREKEREREKKRFVGCCSELFLILCFVSFLITSSVTDTCNCTKIIIIYEIHGSRRRIRIKRDAFIRFYLNAQLWIQRDRMARHEFNGLETSLLSL